MILAVFVGFFIVAGIIAIPQFILKECGEMTIRKSLIARVIISFSYFALLIFLLNYFDSKDQNIGFFELVKEFFKVYSVRYKDFELINLWKGLLDMKLYNNVIWVGIFMFFPQLTLLIPQFLFNKFKEYAETTEESVTERISVSVDSYGNVDAREANIYSTYHPYIWRTALAIVCSVAVFVPILFGIIKYISIVYSMIIVIVIDIIVLIFACKKKKED